MEPSALALDESAKRELLSLTRSTLEDYFTLGKVPEYQPESADLLRSGGAFVSLHNGEDLRGCIGLLASDGELYRTVQRCALSAALEDSRFRPITRDEVAKLTIEISILSPLCRIQDPSIIEVGRHGLIISLGAMRGLLLPQVATKYHWDRNTFLSQTCRKAGLPPDAWRQPNAVIHTFEALVFSD
jgi:uncharacterized protein